MTVTAIYIHLPYISLVSHKLFSSSLNYLHQQRMNYLMFFFVRECLDRLLKAGNVLQVFQTKKGLHQP